MKTVPSSRPSSAWARRARPSEACSCGGTEPGQRPGEPELGIRLDGTCTIEGRPEVVEIALQPGEPDGLQGDPTGVRALGKVEEPAQVGVADRVGFSRGVELLVAVLAQGLQDGIAHLTVRVDLHHRERLVDEPAEEVEHELAGQSVGPADRLACVEIEAAREDAEPAEEHPLRLSEQVVAPVDGCPEGLLAGQRCPASSREDPKAILESGEQVFGGEHLDPRRGELDRQRHAIEPATDVADHLGVVVGQDEARSLGLGAVAEQLDRLEPPGGRRGARAVRVRGRERRDAPHQLAGHAEPLAARGEDAQTHGTAEELVHEL